MTNASYLPSRVKSAQLGYPVSCKQQADKETSNLASSLPHVWVTCVNSLVTHLQFRLVLSSLVAWN